jgi:hypothetical protein
MDSENKFYTIASIGSDEFHSNISEILPRYSHHLTYSGFVGESLNTIKNALSIDPNYVVFVDDKNMLDYLKIHNIPTAGKRIIHVGGFGDVNSGKEKLVSLLDSLPNELPNLKTQGVLLPFKPRVSEDKPRSLLTIIGFK